MFQKSGILSAQVLHFLLFPAAIAIGWCNLATGQNSRIKTSQNLQRSRIYDTAIGKIEVSISPEKASIMLGEPASIEFRIKNLSKHDLYVVQGGDYRNRLGRPASYQVTAIGPDTKPLEVIDAGLSKGGLIGPRKIEKPKGWSRKLFLPNWFVPQTHGIHVVSCKTKLRISKVSDYTTEPSKDATDVEINLQLSLPVLKVRMTEMTRLINSIGKRAISSHDDYAIKKLQAIHDEQTVPYFLKLIQKPSYSLRFQALQGLAKYKSDRALSGIRLGLETSFADMRKNSSNDKVAWQLVKNIRHSASVALSQSPHPQAEEVLLGLWNDPNDAVRITVLHRLGKLKGQASLTLLKKMTQDKSKRVRDEALRYYKIRSGDQ